MAGKLIFIALIATTLVISESVVPISSEVARFPGSTKNGTPEVCSESINQNNFGWEDYMVIVAMMVISCAIGLFYCFFGDKQVTSTDYLLGGGSTGTFPMAMSLTSG